MCEQRFSRFVRSERLGLGDPDCTLLAAFVRLVAARVTVQRCSSRARRTAHAAAHHSKSPFARGGEKGHPAACPRAVRGRPLRDPNFEMSIGLRDATEGPGTTPPRDIGNTSSGTGYRGRITRAITESARRRISGSGEALALAIASYAVES